METNEMRFARLKEKRTIEGQDLEWLLTLAQKAETYENTLSAIANIDTIFMNQDGTERAFDEKEALATIDDMVQPVWKDVCERIRNENKIRF